jgi:hypothetical protein
MLAISGLETIQQRLVRFSRIAKAKFQNKYERGEILE